MPSRLQLALNVDDIGQAVTFYSKLFGTEPAKLRPGYANFAIADCGETNGHTGEPSASAAKCC